MLETPAKHSQQQQKCDVKIRIHIREKYDPGLKQVLFERSPSHLFYEQINPKFW